MKRINLIPKQRRAASKTRSRVNRWITGCAIYGGLVVIAFLLVRFWQDDSTSLAAEMSRLAQSANSAQAAIDEINPQIADKQATIEAARAISEQPDWSVLLVLLGRNVGDDITLNYCEVDPLKAKLLPPNPSLPPAVIAAQQALAAKSSVLPTQFIVRIGGFAPSQKSVSQFVVRLEQIKLFDRVNLIKSDRAPGGDSTTLFRVECTLGGGRRS
jgi:hypothetical protein